MTIQEIVDWLNDSTSCFARDASHGDTKAILVDGILYLKDLEELVKTTKELTHQQWEPEEITRLKDESEARRELINRLTVKCEQLVEDHQKLVNWLLEEVPFKEAHQETSVPRFLCLSRECLEHYRHTGELLLFPNKAQNKEEQL